MSICSHKFWWIVCTFLQCFAEADFYNIPEHLVNKVIPGNFIEPCKGCNQHEKTILSEPNDPCPVGQNPPVTTLVLVRSAIVNGDRRQSIRETWGSKSHRWQRVVFLLAKGSTGALGLHDAVKKESKSRGDVLHAGFEEGYLHLPWKDMLAWRWAEARCSHIRHVLLVSDESFVDPFKLRSYTEQLDREASLSKTTEQKQRKAVSLCYLFPCCTKVWHDHPKYRPRGAPYQSSAFPAYCSGTAYMASAVLMGELYRAALVTAAFMPDDAWTGLLLLKVGASITDASDAYTGISQRDDPLHKLSESRYAQSNTMVVVTDVHYSGRESEIMLELWKRVKRAPKSDHRFSFPLLQPEHPLLVGRLPTTAQRQTKPHESHVNSRTRGFSYEMLIFCFLGAGVVVKLVLSIRKRNRLKNN